MNYAIVVGIILAILAMVKSFISSARTDKIIGELTPLADQDKQDEYADELAKAQQELLNAKIVYNNARRALDQQPSTGLSNGPEGSGPSNK